MFTTGLRPYVPEIPDYSLDDFAMVTMGPSSTPVIYYNPHVCTWAGEELSTFFRAHEHAHVERLHLYLPYSRWMKEFEADCLAAQRVAPLSVLAAVLFFVRYGGGSPEHGTGIERAIRLCVSAGAQ